jgi:hypothetical protein
MRILIRPFELSKRDTLTAALRLLREEGLAVHASWFADADVILLVGQQEAMEVAATLHRFGFKASMETNPVQPEYQVPTKVARWMQTTKLGTARES